jgi:hypothetical protein
MAGYLIAVNYTDGGVAKQVLWGVGDGEFPDQATAIANTITVVTAYRTAHGETPLNAVALVSATR